MDQHIFEQWTNTMPITQLSPIQQQQHHIPIELGGFGIHSFTNAALVFHITSWVSGEQLQGVFANQHSTVNPHRDDDTIQVFAERNCIGIYTLRQRTLSEVMSGMNTKGMQRILTAHKRKEQQAPCGTRHEASPCICGLVSNKS